MRNRSRYGLQLVQSRIADIGGREERQEWSFVITCTRSKHLFDIIYKADYRSDRPQILRW